MCLVAFLLMAVNIRVRILRGVSAAVARFARPAMRLARPARSAARPSDTNWLGVMSIRLIGGLCTLMPVLSLNLVGDGLNEILNPRSEP